MTGMTRMIGMTRYDWMIGMTGMNRMKDLTWITRMTGMTGKTKMTEITRMTKVIGVKNMIRVTGMFFSFWPILSVFWPNRFLLIEFYYKSQIPNLDWTLPFTVSSIIYFPTSLAAYVLSVSIALPAPSRQPLRGHVFQQFLKAYRCLDLLWNVTRWFICITNKERKGMMSAHALKVTSTYVTSTFIYILGKLFNAILLEKHRQDCPNVWWLMSAVWCLVSDVRCLMTDFWCLISDVSFPMPNVWCLVSDVWCLTPDVPCSMFDVSCQCHVWHLMSG